MEFEPMTAGELLIAVRLGAEADLMDAGKETNQAMARLVRLAEFRYELRRFLSFSEMEAERLGVATQQYQLMQVIASLPSTESASISYLADRMVLRHNSTVELVDRAERAGLVKRATDERDLRRSLVMLTEQGKNVLEQLITSHLRELDGSTGEKLLQSLRQVREESETAQEAKQQHTS